MNARLRALLLTIALASPACSKACDATDQPDGAAPGSRALSRDPLGPPSQSEIPTTDGAIAAGNLSGQIDALEAALKRDPREHSSKNELASLLSMRAKYLGRIADMERAALLAEELVRDQPEKAYAYLARAASRAAFHRFAEALADLAEAEKRGAKPAELRVERAGILEGQGDLDGALALRRQAREESATLSTMGTEAALLGQLGKTEEADALFRKALAAYHNVSPFPVAWVLLQQGLLWERAGNKTRARAFFAAAYERLPAYAHAASHLATLEPPARGVALLSTVVAASDDPEFELLLAGRMRANGDAAGADARLAHVRARYAELVAAHPEAFAEHAGFFLLDEGKQPAEAYELAKKDLAVRKTEKAYQLALLAAIAAGKRDEACKLGAEAAKLPHASEMLRGLAADACKK